MFYFTANMMVSASSLAECSVLASWLGRMALFVLLSVCPDCTVCTVCNNNVIHGSNAKVRYVCV